MSTCTRFVGHSGSKPSLPLMNPKKNSLNELLPGPRFPCPMAWLGLQISPELMDTAPALESLSLQDFFNIFLFLLGTRRRCHWAQCFTVQNVNEFSQAQPHSKCCFSKSSISNHSSLAPSFPFVSIIIAGLEFGFRSQSRLLTSNLQAADSSPDFASSCYWGLD